MASTNACVGIDHGTTNSSVAIMESDGPRVIKPNGVDFVMPSAVYMDRRGRVLVGWPAYRAMMTLGRDEGTGYTGYKLRIGQDDKYKFMDGKKVLTAPDLGAMVIKELLRAYQAENPQDGSGLPKACVVTVPAKFDQSACDGTREAARLAGLEFFPQLQEPIAASLAYGFTAKDDRAQWVVFDIGGGTLDISMVIVREGQMIVPEGGHAGDDRLGGRKFDREIFDYVVGELKKTYSLNGFTKDPKHEHDRNRLLLAVERAKIELSKRTEAVVELEGVLCKDSRGTPVKVEVPLTRKQYEKMIETDVARAIHICKAMISQNRLTPGDIDRLILVGGPSQTPCLQQALAEQLGIPLEASIDPMTAVAQGAALYAATVELPEELREDATILVPIPATGEVRIEMKYDKYSRLPTYSVAGRVTAPAGAEEGLTVEIQRSDGLWSSGRLPVGEDGVFECEISLMEAEKPQISAFTTTVYDASGQTVASVDEPQIWYPYPDVEDALKAAASLRVAVRGNDTVILVKKGTGLPARNKEQFVTRKAVRRGSKEDVLRIPVMETEPNLMEEEDDHADSNYLVGMLTIHGDDDRVTTDLPEGSEIDVTIDQDQSRQIKVIAYVPLLGEFFEATFTKEAFGVTDKDIEERFDKQKRRLSEMEDLQRHKPLQEAAAVLDIIRRLNIIADLTKDLQRAKDGDPDARYRAYKHVVKLTGTLHKIAALQRRSRIDYRIEQLEGVCEGMEKTELEVAKSDYATVDSDDTDALARVESQLDEVDSKVRVRPYLELLLDVIALSGRRVSSHQHKLFNEATALIDKIEGKGGARALTDTDLQKVTRMHEKLADAHPELDKWRREALEKLEREHHGPLDISDVERARPATH